MNLTLSRSTTTSGTAATWAVTKAANSGAVRALISPPTVITRASPPCSATCRSKMLEHNGPALPRGLATSAITSSFPCRGGAATTPSFLPRSGTGYRTSEHRDHAVADSYPARSGLNPLRAAQQRLSHRDDASPARYCRRPDPSSRAASMSGFIARPCHDGRSRSMSALPSELAAPVEQLRAKLVEINGSEQTCMTHVVASAPQGTSFPKVQAVMAKCRQVSAAVWPSRSGFRRAGIWVRFDASRLGYIPVSTAVQRTCRIGPGRC